MSILDMFHKAPVNTAAPTPANPAPAPAPVAQAPAGEPAKPTEQTVQPSSQEPNNQSPSDKFKDLWNNDASKQGSTNKVSFNLTPEQISQATAKMDFARAISPADLEKVTTGGTEAVQALSSILNQVGRAVLGSSAQFASALSEAGYNSATRHSAESLPALVKKQFTTNELLSSNSKLRDPAIQPVIQALTDQFQSKYPNATPAEINSNVVEYIKTIAGVFAPEPTTQSQAGAGTNSSFDFSSFLN